MSDRGKSPADRGSWSEFDCPECSAHNPWDDGFTYGDEVFCGWCGCRFVVRRVKDDEGRHRYKLIVD